MKKMKDFLTRSCLGISNGIETETGEKKEGECEMGKKGQRWKSQQF